MSYRRGVVSTLICDDDPRLRLLYRQEFEWAGVEVVEASDGDQCIEVALRERPELIVLDLAMPKRSGLSALPELRRNFPQTPVLVVTQHAAVEVLSRSRELGATACYSKPGFLARIPEVVERYCQTGDAVGDAAAEKVASTLLDDAAAS